MGRALDESVAGGAASAAHVAVAAFAAAASVLYHGGVDAHFVGYALYASLYARAMVVRRDLATR